jgi:hypothetical protein
MKSSTPEIAATLHAEAMQWRAPAAWIVFQDEPDCPGKLVARLATEGATAYVLVADTLAELRTLLPRGLALSERQGADPPDVVECGSGTRSGAANAGSAGCTRASILCRDPK